ncbi:MAG: hypothetical protein OEV42_02990 [Deltaproteobacteria bacterium]|nr:hypothetical protein [Deltaproteobacteria bacterium]
MIVRMKKLSLLLYHRDKEPFLKALQKIGVLHVNPLPDVTSVALEKAIELHERYERSLRVLHEMAAKKEGPFVKELTMEPLCILDAFDELYSCLCKREGDIKGLEKIAEELSPWGNFDPHTIETIQKAGINVRFMVVSREDFQGMDFEDTLCEVISSSRKKRFLLVIERGEKAHLKGTEVHPPMQSLAEILKELNDLREERKKLHLSLERLTPYRPLLKDCETRLKDRIRFREAELHMAGEAEGSLAAMSGWFRHDHENKIRSFLDDFNACYLIESPVPGDEAPVLLENNRFTQLFEPVTKIFSLPSYFELDPTPFFAPFFALFFGLCLADVGYGLIIAVISGFLAFKGPFNLRPLFTMALILGLMTVAGGMMLNTLFGEAIFYRPGVERALFSEGAVFAPLGPYLSESEMVFPGMTFALMLGFIQVILGIVLNGVKRARLSGPLYALQPLSYLLMITGGLVWAAQADVMGLAAAEAGPIPVGAILTGIPAATGKALVFSGLLLLFLFNNPAKKIHIRPLLGLWELYGFATGLMGDILSYLRLFALGLAGALLGNAFNRIAFMIVTDGSGVIHYTSFGMVGTLLILLLGHTLNLGLATLGAFVHSLRLTFVEFYKNLNFEGGGKAFKPLSLHNHSERSS